MKPLRISLIDTGTPREEIDEPLGIETIAAPLRYQYNNSQVDVSLYSQQIPGYEQPSPDWLCDRRIIGISTKLNSYDRMTNIIEKAKDVGDPLIVIGNMYSTYAFDKVLEKYSDVICVRGEGESAFHGIVDTFVDNPSITNETAKKQFYIKDVPNLVFLYNDRIVKTSRKLVTLGSYPRPVRDLLPKVLLKRGVVLVEGSRGCPWSKCKYCAIVGKYGYPVWRGFPESWIIDELISLSNAGVRSPYFTDEDFFGPDPYRAERISNRIIKAKKDGLIRSDMNLYFNARVNTILGQGFGGIKASIPLLTKLKEAGLREIFLGVESGSRDQMKRYKKGATTNFNTDAIELLRSLDIQTDIGFIMFDPEMTMEDLKYNTEFLRRAGLTNHDARMIKQLRVEPHTPMETELIDKGIISSTLDVDDLTYPYKLMDPTVRTIYHIFREWEKGAESFCYRLQAMCRGETKTEKERLKNKADLGMFRELDLKFIGECTRIMERPVYKSSDINRLRERFGRERQKLIKRIRNEI